MTNAPKTLVDLQAKLVRNLHTVNLGIVGDSSHVATGGYHIGAHTLRQNGMSNDYSLDYALDRDATHDHACAIDIGGSPELLMKLGNRIVAALKNRDPRVYNRVRAVNAPWGGQSIDRRYDTEKPNAPSDDNTQSSSDRGHIHLEIYRTLVTHQKVIDDVYSVLAGEPTKSAPAKPTVKPSSNDGIVVTVKRGDTLNKIARAHGTTWRKLQKLNNLKDPNTIYVGEKIQITAGSSKAVAKPKVKTVVVKQGQTLDSIARAHGTTWRKLQKLNNLKNPDLIRVGQKLRIT